MAWLKNFIRDFTLRSDMFAAAPTLRINGQSSYETIFGGCLSILLVIGFMAIFYTSFIEVLNKVNITSSMEIQNNPYGTEELHSIKLAIGIEGLDFSLYQRYFGMVLVEKTIVLGSGPSTRFVDMIPCEKRQWKDLGDNFGKLYELFDMKNMLCPSDSENITVKGFAGSDEFTSYYIMVEQCVNVSSAWVCHDQATINAFFTTHFVTNDYFKVQVYIVDSIISPSQEDPITTRIEQEIFVTFSQNSGSRGRIKMGMYNITTDNSIWPFSETTTLEGYYLKDYKMHTIELFSTHYVKIEIEKDASVYNITREHDKLDNMLSYVGGLFSLLFGWLFFFMGSYNEYKYEVAVAQNAFALDKTGRKIKEKNFGFFTYLRYCLYDWLKTFNVKMSWRQMEEINEAREEVIEQMDIQYLMKKIQRFEIMNKYLMGERNLICANLTRPPTLQQVKKMRKITQYYDKVIKIEDQETILKGILGLGQRNQICNEKEQVLSQKMESGVQKEEQEEVLSDFDSDDQEIENLISDTLVQLEESKNKEEITNRILEGIPKKMERRLRHKHNLASVEKKLVIIENMEDSTSQLESPVTHNFVGSLMRQAKAQNEMSLRK